MGPKAISRKQIDVLIACINDIRDDVEPLKETLNTSKSYQTVFSEPKTTGYSLRVVTLSEMFYCEQIELHQNEFVRISQNIVYIKHLDVLLYKGQFIYVQHQDGHWPKIRICLHESGFSLNISSSGTRIIIVTSILKIAVFYLF